MKEYLLPIKVVSVNDVDNPEGLFINHGFYPMHDGDSSQWSKYTKLNNKDSYIVLDFGQEMSGNIRIFTGIIKEQSCKVRIRFGESLGEVNSSIGEKNACNAHSIRDFETILTFSGSFLFGPSAFRYVRIDVLEDKFIYLRNVFCENEIFNGTQIYDYQGEDKRIKEIFSIAKRTIDLCAGKGYIVDGVKRDQLIWMGDLAPEIMALTTLYKEHDVITNTLEICKKQYPLPRYMNDMASYSMWWIIILNDLYKDNIATSYVEENIPSVIKLVSQMKELIDIDGNISHNYNYIVDWPTVGTVDEEVGIRTIFLMAMNAAESLLKHIGNDLNDIKEIKNRLFKKPFVVKEKKQVVALKYFAFGEINDEEYQLLIKDGPKGFSTFMSYYLLTAIASRDEELAIKLMKEYYGAMIDKGATSFWEDFNIDWVEGSGRIDEINPDLKDIHGDFGAYCYVGFRHSLCHGWSTGVIKFIKEHCK